MEILYLRARLTFVPTYSFTHTHTHAQQLVPLKCMPPSQATSPLLQVASTEQTRAHTAAQPLTAQQPPCETGSAASGSPPCPAQARHAHPGHFCQRGQPDVHNQCLLSTNHTKSFWHQTLNAQLARVYLLFVCKFRSCTLKKAARCSSDCFLQAHACIREAHHCALFLRCDHLWGFLKKDEGAKCKSWAV